VPVDARILEIVDLSRLELEASISAADSMRVRVGQEAQLLVEGSARPIAGAGGAHQPQRAGGQPQRAGLPGVADAPGAAPGPVRAGHAGNRQLPVLAVPLSALRTDKPAPYVQVVEDGKIVHRNVVPGRALARRPGDHGRD
jgi:hypothetical protein